MRCSGFNFHLSITVPFSVNDYFADNQLIQTKLKLNQFKEAGNTSRLLILSFKN